MFSSSRAARTGTGLRTSPWIAVCGERTAVYRRQPVRGVFDIALNGLFDRPGDDFPGRCCETLQALKLGVRRCRENCGYHTYQRSPKVRDRSVQPRPGEFTELNGLLRVQGRRVMTLRALNLRQLMSTALARGRPVEIKPACPGSGHGCGAIPHRNGLCSCYFLRRIHRMASARADPVVD